MPPALLWLVVVLLGPLWDGQESQVALVSYGFDHHPVFLVITSSSGELGLFFQFLEVGSGWPIPHSEVEHFLLMHFFDGGVPELRNDEAHKFYPPGVSESGWLSIPVRVRLELLTFMDPPVFGSSFEVGGSEWHCLRGEGEVGREGLEISEAVPFELFEIVVLPFEEEWGSEHDQLDAEERGIDVGGTDRVGDRIGSSSTWRWSWY
ncbi:hypothetical protein ARMSODRAFT_968146 [Armillaria solidipes]|uniref:Uncharacterized protein n=1 Tax=Armillaria solidipes TaxID=1076256 RepID=A0A2H3CRD1_9AGAR|nr:hypothetical protein ARMSODRAFT_968146 [Armillaria solidipes]